MIDLAQEGLKPFWRYFGGKWRAAPHYPPPQHDTIVEPFAGAAGYSLRYPAHRIILVERFVVVVVVWQYLIAARAAEIRRIPLVEDVDDLPSWVPEGARYLVGFSMNDAVTAPRKRLSAGRKKLRALGRIFEGWSEAQRERVASQVDRIRHWKVIHGDYRDAPDIHATWFIDPPYQKQGVHYKHSSRDINYAALGAWCRTRQGQIIVCEQAGADWLPFQPFGEVKAGPARRSSSEVIWLGGEHTT